MTTFDLAHAPPTTSTFSTDRVLASAAFLAGLFVKIVGFELPTTRLATQIEVASDGNMLPVLIFLAATAILAATRIRSVGLSWPTALPVSFLVLVGWCVFSLTWTRVPEMAGFRLVQAVAIPVFVLLAVESLGVRTILKLTMAVLVASLALDYVYVSILPGAKHLSNEIDSALVGNWRGVHAHKNVAGGVLAIAILFLFRAFAHQRRVWHVLAVAAAVFFLWKTQSKTSVALLLVVSSIFVFLPVAIRNGASSGPVAIGSVVLGLLATIFLLGDLDGFWGFVTDRGAFTGRGALWNIMSSYASGHLWWGTGFGSFWRVGPSGPSYALATGWNAMSYNGHNGYMDALVTIGLPGLLLLVLALVVSPLARGVSAMARRVPDAAFLTSVLLFCVLHNFFETTFLYGSAQLWLLFCIALVCLGQANQEQDA